MLIFIAGETEGKNSDLPKVARESALEDVCSDGTACIYSFPEHLIPLLNNHFAT